MKSDTEMSLPVRCTSKLVQVQKDPVRCMGKTARQGVAMGW